MMPGRQPRKNCFAITVNLRETFSLWLLSGEVARKNTPLRVKFQCIFSEALKPVSIERLPHRKSTMSSNTADSSSKNATSSIEFAALKSNVTIRRDERGIPYIEAASDEDLYFAQGYATACDRLWQMDFLRRTARGELAEILGPGAIEFDRLHRIFGFTHLAEKLLELASPETRTVLESYARGVNAFMATCGADSLPVEFKVLRYEPREWTAVDSLALGKLFAEQLSFSLDVDILRALLSDLTREKLATLLPEVSPLDVLLVGNDVGEDQQNTPFQADENSVLDLLSEVEVAALTSFLGAMRRSRAAAGGDDQVGSNSWVVSGRLTSSGKPMLANDPHLAPTSPSIWHIVHLSTPDLKVSGVSVPGLPGVMIGHNNDIAWGITNLCPDVQDLYFERFAESDPSLYKTPSGWRAAEIRREELKVRQSLDDSTSVTVDVKVTRHGPVILESGTFALALRWTALATDLIDLDAILAINRARNWDDFVDALRGYGGPPQNFTYADTAGHIGYYSAGRIPVRSSGDGSVPYDGSTDAGEWIGFIPFDELPHIFDPPSGIIVTANNRLIGNDYPHHLTHNWRVPYRALRIHDRLSAKPILDAADFMSILGDTYSYPDVIFISEILKLAGPLRATSPEWREMADAFAGWDGYSNAESTVLPLATAMRTAFRDQILSQALGMERAQLFDWRNESTFIDWLITERPIAWLPDGVASFESLLLNCYRQAKEKLAERYGLSPTAWQWGKLASVQFRHPLEKMGAIGTRFATSAFPQHTGGSMPTVNAGSRVSMRLIADLSDWSLTRLGIPLGQSGDPASLNHHDQFADWHNVTPGVLPFDHDLIATSTRNILTLKASRD